MKNHINILFIALISISILSIELNVLEFLSNDINIEMIDFNEEGSGEKDSNDSSSEKDITPDYFMNNAYKNKMILANHDSSNYAYQLPTVNLHSDIFLPPPERI